MWKKYWGYLYFGKALLKQADQIILHGYVNILKFMKHCDNINIKTFTYVFFLLFASKYKDLNKWMKKKCPYFHFLKQATMIVFRYLIIKSQSAI